MGDLIPEAPASPADIDKLRDYVLSKETYVDTCLLYTSDAADDLLCVDLGGRRIIKKKKTMWIEAITINWQYRQAAIPYSWLE